MENFHQATNTIKNFLISKDGLDLQCDGDYFMYDNNITDSKLTELSYKLYKMSMQLATRDIRESRIENETKIPCINKV